MSNHEQAVDVLAHWSALILDTEGLHLGYEVGHTDVEPSEIVRHNHAMHADWAKRLAKYHAKGHYGARLDLDALPAPISDHTRPDVLLELFDIATATRVVRCLPLASVSAEDLTPVFRAMIKECRRRARLRPAS